MNNKLGKLLVMFGSIAVLISILIFAIFASKIFWRDLQNMIYGQEKFVMKEEIN